MRSRSIRSLQRSHRLSDRVAWGTMRGVGHLGVFFLAGWLLFAPAASALNGAPDRAIYGVDLRGHNVEQLATPETRVVVLIFLASDCPVSNRYLPAIRRLESEFETQHVAFWVVYPNPGDTAAVIQQHQAQFGKLGNEVRDPQHALVRLADVRITPEAAVLVPDGKTLRRLYHGRIDNRYIALGTQRPKATQHDLENAISAGLEGQKVQKPYEPPVGCFIVTQP